MKKTCFIILLICSSSVMMAQQRLKVGDNPTTISPTAVLEIESTNKGFLPPRMTSTQRDAITTPSTGLQVYCTDCSPAGLYNYNGSVWAPIGSLTGGNLSSGNIVVGNASNQATSVAMSGDITINNSGATTIANSAVTYAKIQNVSATDKVLGRTTAGAGVIEEISTTGTGNVVRANAPTFTGDAKAVTATAGDKDTSIATTAFVDAAVTKAGSGGIYNGSGSLSANTTVAQGANTLSFTSSATNGFSVGTALQINPVSNYVGINRTPTGTPLEVQSNSTTVAGRFINTFADANGIITIEQGYDAANPGYFQDFVKFFYNGSPVGSIAGANTTFGTVSGLQFLTASDFRLKNNIHDTRYSLTDLLKIKVRDYYFNNDPSATTYSNGFIAQELFEVYPDAVAKGNDDVDEKGNLKHIWTVDYGKLTPLLTKSIQDLNAKVENQNKEIEALKAQVEELKNMILNK